MVPAPTFVLRADRRVAEIGQVIRLRAFAHVGLLELDEVADVGILADLGARPDMRERTEEAPASTVESVTTVWFRTHTRSPMVELTMRAPEWISQAAPILVEPSRKTHG